MLSDASHSGVWARSEGGGEEREEGGEGEGERERSFDHMTPLNETSPNSLHDSVCTPESDDPIV